MTYGEAKGVGVDVGGERLTTGTAEGSPLIVTSSPETQPLRSPGRQHTCHQVLSALRPITENVSPLLAVPRTA
jgi:hypothetical protein